MLRIYLPSSTDLELCSDVPTVDFVDTWTFVTVFKSRYILVSSDLLMARGIWDPSFWSRDGGSQHLGPKSSGPSTQDPSFGSQVFGSLISMRHLTGPGSGTIRVLGPRDPLRAFAPVFHLNLLQNGNLFGLYYHKFNPVVRWICSHFCENSI